jgi:hypothetical protein
MALARRIRFNPFYRRQAEGCWRLARPRRFAPSKGPTRRGNQVMSEPTTIIGGPVSPYVRKAMAVCDVKGVAYRIDPIIPFQGNDEFSRLSPLRRIPVLIDDQVTLSDSTVIAEYLDERHGKPGLFPDTPAARARARWRWRG